jgi:hypothetical protein
MITVFCRLRAFWTLLALFAACTVANVQLQRVPNTTLAMPPSPVEVGISNE